MVLGALAFCVELAQNSGSTWGAVWLRDGVGTSASTAAAGLAILLAGTTAGRLAGDRLRVRFGPARLFRAAGSLQGETAPAVARVATLGALGSFTAPALIGGLAGPLNLAGALALPALLVAATALAANAVEPATNARSGSRLAPTQPG